MTSATAAYSYCRPGGLDEALELFGQAPEQIRVIAGGTDLMLMLRDGHLPACRLLDLSRVDELRGITLDDDGLQIGAGTTYSELLADPDVAAQAPVLHEAARQVGSVQIRNLGTIGGNLANASPAGDLIPPLLVTDALLTLRKLGSSREVPIGEFFLGVRRTVLEPGELLTRISIPRKSAGTADRFFKHGPRDAQAIALVNVALRARVSDAGLDDVRLALGCVGPIVIRAPKTEAALANAGLDATRIRAAAATVAEEISPIDDLRGSASFRSRMAAALVAQAALELVGLAE